MAEEDGAAHGGLGERRLTRLLDVGRALVSELDLDAVLNRVLDAARDVTGARYAALGILDGRRAGLERFVTLGIDERTRRVIGNLPRGRGVLGLLIEDPTPLRLSRVGDHPRSFGFPHGHPPMDTFLGVPIMIRGEAFGNIYLTEKDGGEFDEADEQAVVILAEWASIAIENARLYTTVRERRAELERAVRGLEATTEIARAVGGETDLGRVLETVAKRGRALVEARTVLVMLEDRGELEVVNWAGDLEREVVGERVPLDSAWGRVCRDGLPERIGAAGARLGFDPGDLGSRAESALLVPLTFRGQALGLIVAFDRLRDGPEFDAEDERLLIAFAASAATAVATAQTVAEDRLRFSIDASERERSTWARELHDETLQGLGALRVSLSAALRGGGERLENAVEVAVAQLADEIANLRSLIAELRPVALDELGLEAALETLVEHSQATSGVEIDARIDMRYGAERSERLDREIESSVYRIVQEALTNISKHSRAEHVDLEATEGRDWIRLRIRDDGVGFDTSRRSNGFGLRGMRERAALVNGRMSIASAPGSGTEIKIEIPTSLRSVHSAIRGAAGNY
ncbi:MAG TPA: GAF domain-containing protein [Solirubrobacterales bacterium]|nr:GAF domain-containing protein [Solirubrobacterales bacterium]